jgi:hypothetical protein
MVSARSEPEKKIWVSGGFNPKTPVAYGPGPLRSPPLILSPVPNTPNSEFAQGSSYESESNLNTSYKHQG